MRDGSHGTRDGGYATRNGNTVDGISSVDHPLPWTAPGLFPFSVALRREFSLNSRLSPPRGGKRLLVAYSVEGERRHGRTSGLFGIVRDDVHFNEMVITAHGVAVQLITMTGSAASTREEIVVVNCIRTGCLTLFSRDVLL